MVSGKVTAAVVLALGLFIWAIEVGRQGHYACDQRTGAAAWCGSPDHGITSAAVAGVTGAALVLLGHALGMTVFALGLIWSWHLSITRTTITLTWVTGLMAALYTAWPTSISTVMSDPIPVVVCVLWLLGAALAWGSNDIDTVVNGGPYWCAQLTVAGAMCVVVMTSDRATTPTDDVAPRVYRARRTAVLIIWGLLAMYTFYLLQQLIQVVTDYADNELNTTFNERWVMTTTIPHNTSFCNILDVENARYGLLYDDQRHTAEDDRFQCAYGTHEAVRLNIMAAVTIWVIYGVSTKPTVIDLIRILLIFVGISTAIDDLRHYWKLRMEQAIVLTVAVAITLLQYIYTKRTTSQNVLQGWPWSSSTKKLVQPQHETTGLLSKQPFSDQSIALDF